MRQLPPADTAGKIEFTGRHLFGPCWRARTAAGLGISRSTLRLWIRGESKANRDIEGELVLLVDRERAATASRRIELTALRNDLLASGRKSDAA